MKYSLAILALLAAVTASPARAAPDSDDVAQCVVDNDLHDVRMLLSSLPGSDDERRAGAKIMTFYGGCSDNRIATGQLAWRERAELANAALLGWLEGGRFDAASPPPRARWALAVGESQSGYDRNLVSLRQFGDCIVGLDPAGALRLARSSRGSAGEFLPSSRWRRRSTIALPPARTSR